MVSCSYCDSTQSQQCNYTYTNSGTNYSNNSANLKKPRFPNRLITFFVMTTLYASHKSANFSRNTHLE